MIIVNNKEIFRKYSSKEDFEKLIPLNNIVELLNKMENEYSELVSVITNEGNISYKQLCDDTKSVVSALKVNDITVGNVGVIGPNNYNFTKASLGVMANGCCATLLPVQLDEKMIYGCCLKYSLHLWLACLCL